MKTFMNLVLGLGILLIVSSIYLVLVVSDASLEGKIIFCLFAAGMIYFGWYRGVRRVLVDDKKRKENKKK